MPATITPTTLDALEASFEAAIAGIVPEYPAHAAELFKLHRRRTRAKTGARWFRLEWDDEGPTDGGWYGKNAYDNESTLSVFVDYGGVPRETVKKLAASDFAQIADVLYSLQFSNNSLMRVVRIAWDFSEENRGDQAQIVHQYRVGWIKQRNVTT